LAHFLELRAGGHLLSEQRGLDAVEQPFEPADQLRLRDSQLGIRRDGVAGERQAQPGELLTQLGRKTARELLDRAVVDLAEPDPAGVVERRGTHFLEELLDHRADPHDLRGLLDHLADDVGVGGLGVGTVGHLVDRRSIGADSHDAEGFGAVGWCGHAPIVSENPLVTTGRVREAAAVSIVDTIRDATADDADAILEVALLSDLAEIGEPNTTIDAVQSDLRMDGLVGAVIPDPAGGLLGYAWVEHQPGHLKTWGDITVRPGADAAVAPVLLDWLRVKAQELGPGLPTHTFADSTNAMKQRLYEAAGGTVIRRFYRMGVGLDDAPPPAVPALGEGVGIRPITPGENDQRAMHAVVDVAFMDHFGHERESYEQWLEHTANGGCPDLSLWWMATVDGEPAAGLYACELPEAGYVDTLGTLRDHRGKGLGRALLLTAFAEYYRRGLRRVVLGVDATSPTGALDLYQSVGMTAEHEGWRYELPGPSAL
jgi:mycothiol synthase